MFPALPPLAPPSYIPYIHPIMNRPIHTKTFKSGNSVAMRLPKGLGIGPGEQFAVTFGGDFLSGRRIPTAAEEAGRLVRFRAMLDELKRLGPVGEIQEREPFEFPDRPGL
jgi:antitoxin VapB